MVLRGSSALHLAARSGSADTVSFLLNAGLSPQQRDSGGNTPLHWLVTKENCGADDDEILDVLVHNGEPPVFPDNDVLDEDFFLQKEVLQNLNAQNKDGVSVLSAAAQALRADLVSILLEKYGPLLRPNLADANGWTPLHYLALTNKQNDAAAAEVVWELLSAKSWSPNTSISTSCGSREDYLRGGGPDPHVGAGNPAARPEWMMWEDGADDHDEWMWEASDDEVSWMGGGDEEDGDGREEFSEIAAEDADARDNWLGATPLHYAAQQDLVLVAETLLSAQEVYGERRTALHYAAENRNEEMWDMLIAYGADEHREDSRGVTPLFIYQTRGRGLAGSDF